MHTSYAYANDDWLTSVDGIPYAFDADGRLVEKNTGACMPVAMTSGGARYYLGYDQVGFLRVVADASGAVVKEIAYD